MRAAAFTALLLASLCQAQEPAAIDWARRESIPLDTVLPLSGFADMQPLKAVVGNARIVSLGEATHGTREFFQMKHRMLEFLATEMGFRIFSIEANMPEAYRLNDYVLNGVGDPEALVKGMYVFTWRTEEVLDMVRWMREFNASGRGPLQFTGFDMQTPDVAMDIVLDFLARAEPDYLVQASPAYSEYKNFYRHYGLVSASLPIKLAAGKRVRFSGYIKTDRIQRGFAGLWLGVYRGSEAIFTDNMSTRGIRGTTGWTRYDIVADVPRDATGLSFGGLHPGDGSAWFDSFSLELDGVPYLDNSRFDLGFEGATPRGFYLGGDGFSVAIDRSVAQSGSQSVRSIYHGVSGDDLYSLSSAVLDHMVAARDQYLAAGFGDWDTDWAIQNARIVAQAMNQELGSSNRDADMARNIGWILDHNPGEKIVLWAHNLHVAAGGIPDWVSMGSFLRESYGPDMVVFGFAFNRGGFQAINSVTLALQPFEVPPAAEGSFDAALAATGIPIFALDLRAIPASGPPSWFRDPHPHREIGGQFGDGFPGYLTFSLPAAYDAVFFIDSTTRARPLQP